MIYSPTAWLALREYAAEKLRIPKGGCKGADPRYASWRALEESFMKERGYAVHYPPKGLHLCRPSPSRPSPSRRSSRSSQGGGEDGHHKEPSPLPLSSGEDFAAARVAKVLQRMHK